MFVSSVKFLLDPLKSNMELNMYLTCLSKFIVLNSKRKPMQTKNKNRTPTKSKKLRKNRKPMRLRMVMMARVASSLSPSTLTSVSSAKRTVATPRSRITVKLNPNNNWHSSFSKFLIACKLKTTKMKTATMHTLA